MIAVGGAALLLGGLVVLLDAGARPTPAMGTWSALRRGLFVVAQHPDARVLAVMTMVLGALALAAAWYLLRRPVRWPLLAVPPVALYLFVMAWRGRDWVARFEPVGYRAHSPYVKAATALATVGSLYLVALVVVAIAAWVTARASAPAPASTAPPPT